MEYTFITRRNIVRNWLLEPVKGIAFSFTVRRLYVICPTTKVIVIDVGLLFLLSVAGHTMQKLTDGEEEEDGKDECNCIPCLFSFQIISTLLTISDIVTSDNDIIQDNVSLSFIFWKLIIQSYVH